MGNLQMNQPNQKRIIIILAGAIFLGLLAFLIVLSFRQNNETPIDPNGAYSEEQIELPTIIVRNDYQLYHSIGSSCSAEAFDQIRAVIRKDAETKETLYATLDESTFKRYTSTPQVYTFIIKTSEEKSYLVYVRTDTEKNEDEEERRQRTSTLVKLVDSDEEYTFNTSAVNEILLENLEKWRQKF